MSLVESYLAVDGYTFQLQCFFNCLIPNHWRRRRCTIWGIKVKINVTKDQFPSIQLNTENFQWNLTKLWMCNKCLKIYFPVRCYNKKSLRKLWELTQIACSLRVWESCWHVRAWQPLDPSSGIPNDVTALIIWRR